MAETIGDSAWKQWQWDVNQLCQKHLKCGWADLAGDEEPLRLAFQSGMSPLEFVKAHAAEYGLDWFHDDGRPWDVGTALPTPYQERLEDVIGTIQRMVMPEGIGNLVDAVAELVRERNDLRAEVDRLTAAKEG